MSSCCVAGVVRHAAATGRCCRARHRRRCRSPAPARSPAPGPSGSAGPGATSAARTRAGPWSPVQVGDIDLSAGRWAVGDDAPAPQLDHAIGDAGDLAVVGDDEHRLRRRCACACSSSRIWTPVRKSSSPVGSSASSTGLPVASARAIATRCCSPPESCVREVVRAGRPGRPRSSVFAGACRGSPAGRRRRRRTARSPARSVRGTG